MLLINDLRRHFQSTRELTETAVIRVTRSGWYVLGDEVAAFEEEFAAYCGVAECVGVGNGTDALELALRALGIGPGKRVATAANAGMYSTTAILNAGAEPVYLDVDPVTRNLNPQPVDADALIVTHLYGRMAPMPEILVSAGSIPVIEDCAQAHGASLAGRRGGSWGTMGCFSFYPTKNLGCIGDGGAIVTPNPDIAQRLRSLRQYGWTAKYRADIPGGRNSRLDEIQAAVLRAKLPHLDGWNARRREIAALYDGRSRGLDDVVHLYVVNARRRDALREHLHSAGIATDVHYPTPDYRQAAAVQSIRLPHTENCCATVLSLPCFPEMTDGEVLRVRDEIRRFETLYGADES